MPRKVYVSRFDDFRNKHGPGKCGYCGKDLPKRRQYWCSDECVNAIYNLSAWSYLRVQALEKAGRKCERCGDTGTYPNQWGRWSDLEVHHIIPISEGGEEFDLKNLIVLCRKHHREEHTRTGKLRRQHRTLDKWELA